MAFIEQIEQETRGMAPEQRFAIRNTHAAKVLARLKNRLNQSILTVPLKTCFAHRFGISGGVHGTVLITNKQRKRRILMPSIFLRTVLAGLALSMMGPSECPTEIDCDIPGVCDPVENPSYANASAGNYDDLDSALTPFGYQLAPGYSPDDVVGVGQDGYADWTFVWYNDGRYSAGTTDDLDAFITARTYSLPPGYYPGNIVGIGQDGNADWTFVWFDDGKMSAGIAEDLDVHFAPTPYTLPPGYTPADVVGIGSDGNADWAFVWFDDGKWSGGTITDLDRYIAPEPYSLPPGYSPRDIVGIGSDGPADWTWVYYNHY